MADINDNIGLFIHGYSEDGGSDSMPLFIGAESNVYNSLTLYIHNQGTTGSLPLRITGAGEFSGALPGSSSMNLFVGNNQQLVYGYLSLYIFADIPNNSIPLFIDGAYTEENSMTLVMPEVIGLSDNNIRLFVGGY